MDENVSLKIRKGAQIFGPMTLVQVAELLASGRIGETDEVSTDGQNWQPITAYFEQQLASQSAPASEEPAAVASESGDDDFLPDFGDAGSSAEAHSTLFDDDEDSSEPPSTLFDDEPEDLDDDEDDDDEPIVPVKPRKKRDRRKQPPRRRKPEHDLDDDPDDDPEGDAESSNLDDVLRKLLEYEQSAPALNEERARPRSGGRKSKAPSMKLTADERRDGFVMMFNGKNFSGWRFRDRSALPEQMPENWRAERGCVCLNGGGKPALMSQWEYHDFDLRFVWRAADEPYNSGLCLRSDRKVGKNQICLRQGKEGTFRGGQIEGAKNAKKLQNPPGQWNEWRVLAEGDKLTLWCNGKQAWKATGFEPDDGYIGFLAAGSQFEFANLRIKELGFDHLNDIREFWSAVDVQSNRWKQLGDSLVGEKGKSGPLETINDEYRDFVIRLDWKLTKAAEGTLYLRGADCAEAGVRLGGAKKGSGGLPAIHIEPDEKLDNPPGQWNFLEARVVKNVVAIRLNGEEVVERAKLPRGGTTQASGPIALSYNGRPIQFRNIRIRTLDGADGKSKWLGGGLFGRKSD